MESVKDEIRSLLLFLYDVAPLIFSSVYNHPHLFGTNCLFLSL